MSRLLKSPNGSVRAVGDGWPELSSPAQPAAGRPAPEEAGAAAGSAGERVAAARLLAQARRQAEALREQARAEGYAAGYAEGMAAARRRLQAALGAVRSLLLESLRLRAAEDREQADALAELAAALAERLVGAAVAEDPQRLLGLLRQVVDELDAARPVEVRAHPRDVAAVAAAAAEGSGALLRLRVVEDPGLEPGDLVVASDRGRVELRPRRLIRTLLEAAVEEEDGHVG